MKWCEEGELEKRLIKEANEPWAIWTLVFDNHRLYECGWTGTKHNAYKEYFKDFNDVNKRFGPLIKKCRNLTVKNGPDKRTIELIKKSRKRKTLHALDKADLELLAGLKQ